jgi:hypothetical protein
LQSGYLQDIDIINGQFGTYENLGLMAKGGMGKIFKAKVITFDVPAYKRELSDTDYQTGPKVGQVIIIKFVKKKDDMNLNELKILKLIKKNPQKQARFANLYDHWEQ